MLTLKSLKPRRGGLFRLLLIISISVGIITGISVIALNHANAEPAELADANNVHNDVYINKLELTGYKSGTAPFDDNDNAGNDSSDSNDVIRTFDEISMDYKYMVNVKTSSLYKNGRIGFRIELPYNTNTASFSTDKMLWLDKTSGYEYKITTENINGVRTQVLTGYKYVNGINNQTVFPGSGTVNVVIKVNGAANRSIIRPVVKAWVSDYETNHVDNADIITGNGKSFTVSAAPNYNLRIGAYKTQFVKKIDFNNFNKKAYSSYYNSNIGNVRGRLFSVVVELDARKQNRTKGIKGIEMPTGDVKFRMTVKTSLFDKNHRKITMDDNDLANIQPYLYDYGGLDGSDSVRSRQLRIPYWDLFADKVLANNNEYSITETRTGNSSIYDYTLKTDNMKFADFQATDMTNPSLGSCSPTFMSSDCSHHEVAALKTMTMYGFVPSNFVNLNNNEKISSKYPNGFKINYNISITGLQMSSMSGVKLPIVDDNSNQTVTNDDNMSWNNDLEEYTGNNRSQQYVGFMCKEPHYHWEGTDCSNKWYDGNVNDGSDIGFPGERIHIRIKIRTLRPYDYPVPSIQLFKFDPDVFDFRNVIIHRNAQAARETTVYYGVKPDGSKWQSVDEQKNTKIKDLTYYKTYAEAS